MAESGSLVTRNYRSFKGIDFSNRGDEVNLYRTPDALNVWRNYRNTQGRAVETRPDIDLVKGFTETIYGLFFYTYNSQKHRIVHAGTKLYDNDKVIYNSMATRKSQAFVYEKLFYIKDGNKYLVYDGATVKEVEGFIPTTTIGRSPSGGGTVYQDVNLLTGVRKNSFVADGSSKDYFVDSESFDSDYKVRAWVNGKETTGFTTDATTGKITFTEAPAEPNTVGQDNVIIQFRKNVSGYRAKIDKCTLLEVFDNRVFFSGNPDYPNMLWHCSLEDPTYCSDLDYYKEGQDDSAIKALVSGNNALWVMKEPSQSNTTIFYHNPTIDDEIGKVYPSTHSSISTGCVSTGVNFNDDIVFFSERGMEAITGDVTTEQALSHRSTFVDNRLINEPNYKNLILVEWEGYLLVITGNRIYLADSNAEIKYEWYLWQFDMNITGARVDNGTLYLYSDKNIYSLTNTSQSRNVEAYITTIEDEFTKPHYYKSSNKKGCVIDCTGDITVSVKTDNNNFEKIDTFKNTKGYVVCKKKKKKFKSIQYKFSSTRPFELYSATLECYILSYVKR